MIGIYMYTNRLNSKRYIGKSVDIEARKGKHRRNAKDGRASYFYNALRHYGENVFDFEVLEECSVEQLDEKEKFYISKYDTLMPNGYNMTEGGTGGNPYKSRTEEQNLATRKKMSESHTGLKHTREALAKMSAAQKGKPHYYARGRAGWNKGKKMTAEFCKAVSDAVKGSGNGMFRKQQSDLNRKINSEVHKGQIPANKGKHLVWDNPEHTKHHYE